jgi:Predicted membrane protein/domain
MTAEEIARSYGPLIILPRWAATWIDFIVLASSLVIPHAVLGDRLYRKTIFIWLALILLYYPLLEGFTGYTLGKLIMRIKVVDPTGRRPGLLKALQRTLTRLIEVNPFLLGGIPAGVAVWISKTRQRLGDMWAKTFVLKTADLAQLE